MALPPSATASASASASAAHRRPPSLLHPRPPSGRGHCRRPPVAAARSSPSPAASAEPACDVERAYYFAPSAAQVLAAKNAAAAAADDYAPVRPPHPSSSSGGGSGGGIGYYGGSPPDSPAARHSGTPATASPSSFWDAVGGLAARAAEAAAPQVVLLPDALAPAAAAAVARECRALRPRLAPELNCIASGRLGCYLSARSATHAALAGDAALASKLTRALRSALPLEFCGYPVELRRYPTGSSMPWHSDEALTRAPQWELIYTVDNDSDSETEWRDAGGRARRAWTPPGSLLCVRAEGWQHRVSPVRRGSRLIVKLAYSPRGAAKLPSFALNLGRAAYDRGAEE